MADFYWPTLLEPASSRLEILSNAGRFQSPTSGFTRTISRPGERMRLTLSFENTNGAMRAALQSYLAGMRGAVHRVHAHDHSNRLRGSFPATELLSNNTFANGTTGWSGDTPPARSVTERVMRLLWSSNGTTNTTALTPTAALTLTQYAPHVFRAMLMQGRGSMQTQLGAGVSASTEEYGTDTLAATYGQRSLAFVPYQASSYVNLMLAYSGLLPGDYLDIPYLSLSRCAQVDNGANMLTRSDEFDHADWTKTESSATANATASPDGTSTADSLVESTTATISHLVSRNVTVPSTSGVDLCFTVAVKAGARTWCIVLMREATGVTDVYTYVNLATGAVGAQATGANWANRRVFVTNVGNGWYEISIVARKTNAATTVSPRVYLSTGDGVSAYTGDGTSNIYAWRATLAQSSVPVRLTQTTTTAVASGTSQALAGGLHTKGWPASTNGLLLPGDQVQIGNQLLIVTAALNSDAAGRGFLQTAPPLRSAPADNAPVIINQPMGKFFLESDASGWDNKPGIFSDAEVVLAEAA